MPTKEKSSTKKWRKAGIAQRDPADLATAFMTSRMLHVAVKLGIPEVLGDEPASAEELARATGSHPPSLVRLLRGLAGIGVLSEGDPGRFRLTEAGTRLRRDHPASILPLVLECGAPHVQAAWAELGHAVRTGRPAFYYALGAEYWPYLGRHPDIAAGSLEALSESERSVVTRHDFSGVSTVVDVGGGRGELCAAILARNEEMSGAVFDLTALAAEAEAFLAESGLAERASFVGGDFFTEVPDGADAYVLANVLSDWSDEDASRILGVCRRAMRPDSRLVIVERSPAAEPAFADLHRMVLFGAARERSDEELRELLEARGFTPGPIARSDQGLRIIEATPSASEERGRG